MPVHRHHQPQAPRGVDDRLGPRRGAMQGLSAAPITCTGAVRWHATAPTRARARAGRRSLAGTAVRATPPSACCRSVWPHGFLGSWTRSNRWWPTPSRPRAWPRRAMRCAAMRSSSRGRPERDPGLTLPITSAPGHAPRPRSARTDRALRSGSGVTTRVHSRSKVGRNVGQAYKQRKTPRRNGNLQQSSTLH